jgi:hypothetical protein
MDEFEKWIIKDTVKQVLYAVQVYAIFMTVAWTFMYV